MALSIAIARVRVFIAVEKKSLFALEIVEGFSTYPAIRTDDLGFAIGIFFGDLFPAAA